MMRETVNPKKTFLGVKENKFVVFECPDCHLASVHRVKENQKIISCSFCRFYGELVGSVFSSEENAIKKKVLHNKKVGLGRI
jgi:ribosomal protein L37AE/L43A